MIGEIIGLLQSPIRNVLSALQNKEEATGKAEEAAPAEETPAAEAAPEASADATEAPSAE